MKQIEPGVIQSAVEQFLRVDSQLPAARRRERSWDFCFNHFQDHVRPTRVMDLSCLHLGYYLASWGMLRGSSFLFTKTNVLHYRPVVEVIEKHNETMNAYDVPTYRDSQSKAHLDAAWTDLRACLLPDGGRGLTLISKVMMGVWGCVPSFDTYFVRTYRNLAETKQEASAFSRVGIDALGLLGDVYERHADEIDAVRQRYTTWDMTTGQPTERPMTRAKVLDIYGFQNAFAS